MTSAAGSATAAEFLPTSGSVEAHRSFCSGGVATVVAGRLLSRFTQWRHANRSKSCHACRSLAQMQHQAFEVWEPGAMNLLSMPGRHRWCLPPEHCVPSSQRIVSAGWSADSRSDPLDRADRSEQARGAPASGGQAAPLAFARCLHLLGVARCAHHASAAVLARRRHLAALCPDVQAQVFHKLY